MRIYGYLRASTDQQDANRAKNELIRFSEQNNFKIAAWFVENQSGAKLARPELMRLIDIAVAGDIILIEQVDRITRLTTADWNTLKETIGTKGLKIVSLDLPTSHQFLNQVGDDFTNRMFSAVNSMMLDMLAAVARKDYEDRRRRQAEGVQKAKSQGKYKGRPLDIKLRKKIKILLQDGKTYSQIQDFLGCSRDTISKISKQLKENIAT